MTMTTTSGFIYHLLGLGVQDWATLFAVFRISTTVGTGLTPGASLLGLGIFEAADYQTRKAPSYK